MGFLGLATSSDMARRSESIAQALVQLSNSVTSLRMSTAQDLAQVTAALQGQAAALSTAGNALVAAYNAAKANPGPITQADLDTAVAALNAVLQGEQAETAALQTAVQ